MKNFVSLLVVLALIGSATAQTGYAPNTWGFAKSPAPTDDGVPENPYTFSLDGDLTALTPDIWGTWGGDSGGTKAAPVLGGVLTMTTNSYELAFSHDQAVVDLPGAPVAGLDNVMVVIDVKSVTGPGFVSCKIECYDSTDAFPNDDNGAGATVIYDWDVDAGVQYTAPGVYTFSTADAVLSNAGPIPAGTVAVTPVIVVAGGNATTDTVVEFNSIYILKAYSPFPSDPIPADGSAVAFGSTTELAWSNPDPADDSTASGLGIRVRFESEGVVGDPIDPNFTASWVALADDAEVADLASDLSATLPLADNTQWSWQVEVTDANSAGSIVSEGPVWTFEVGDAPPVITSPANDYMWVSQADGDGDDTIRTFTVSFDYTDDGKSPITAVDVNNLNWGWDPLDTAGNGAEFGLREVGGVVWTPAGATGTVSQTYETVFEDGGDPNLSTTIPGFWNIRLEITDGTGTVLGTATHYEIDETCADAAVADPDDNFDPVYDADQNCKNDFVDFAAFAAAWLDQSVSYE
jgi:hypothetical protein